MTTSISTERAWYVIDIATGAHLDEAERGHRITLPTGTEVTVTGHNRPWGLTWQDPHPRRGTTDSGGSMTLKSWIDSSTTITLKHYLDLPVGVAWSAVRTHQQLLDTQAKNHAGAWVPRFARHGSANTGNA